MSLIRSFGRSTKRVVKETLFKVLSIRLTSKIKYKQTTSARQFLTTQIVVRPSFIIYYSENKQRSVELLLSQLRLQINK